MENLKRIEDFLNSLESEQMSEAQDAIILSGLSEDLSGSSMNQKRCHNLSLCSVSTNDRRCFNSKNNCSDAVNYSRCKVLKPKKLKK